jgi:hypothetical protein
MATPNSRPNDSGHKTLIASAWEARKATKKSKKDFWDKADIVAKGAIGLFTALVAIVVAVIGWKLQESIATQSTGKDYLSIALGILEQKDLPEDLKKNKGLRKWAVNLLQHYSQEKLDVDTANQLIDGETILPNVVAPGRVSTAEQSEATAKGEVRAIMAQSADGKLKAEVSISGQVYITTSGGVLLQALPERLPFLNGAAFSPDDKYLVTYDSDKFAVVNTFGDLSVNQGEHRGGIQSVAFSGNDVIIVSDPNGKQTKYDLTGKQIP